MLAYHATCLPEWTDYNQHMNDAMYGRVFSDAIDALMINVGLNSEYRRSTSCTIYTLEDHRWYEREVHEGAHLTVETHVIEVDQKRIHVWQALLVAGERCAVSETMLMHISQEDQMPKAAIMPDHIQRAVQTHLTHSDLLPRAGRMGFTQKK